MCHHGLGKRQEGTDGALGLEKLIIGGLIDFTQKGDQKRPPGGVTGKELEDTGYSGEGWL